MSHYKLKQVLLVRKDLGMSRGKEIAQCAHASMGIILEGRRDYCESHRDETGHSKTVHFVHYQIPEGTEDWYRESFAKICVRVHSEEELLALIEQAKAAGIPAIAIKDTGTTSCGTAGRGVEVFTAGAIGPWHSEEIDKITGKLQLY